MIILQNAEASVQNIYCNREKKNSINHISDSLRANICYWDKNKTYFFTKTCNRKFIITFLFYCLTRIFLNVYFLSFSIFCVQ